MDHSRVSREERKEKARSIKEASGGFPRSFWILPGSSGKESTCQCRRHRRPRFNPWVRKIPWRRTWQPTPVFFPGESHGQRNLVGYSPWGCKRVRQDLVTKQQQLLLHIIKISNSLIKCHLRLLIFTQMSDVKSY